MNVRSAEIRDRRVFECDTPSAGGTAERKHPSRLREDPSHLVFVYF